MSHFHELGTDFVIDAIQGGKPPDLSKHDLKIFAEIVEAPTVPIERPLERARAHKDVWRTSAKCLHRTTVGAGLLRAAIRR